jgi:putative glutamine transport system substrate-binding protein
MGGSQLRPASIAAILTAVALVAAACGGGGAPAGQSPAADPCRAVTFEVQTHMAQIQRTGKLKAGVREDDIVFGNKNPTTNKFEGFDIDVVREIGKALFKVGDEKVDDCIEFVPITSATRIPSLQENKADVVAATMTITGDRLKQIDFSNVYFRTGQRILVKKDNNAIREVEDLNGKTVCAARGSTSERNIQQRAPQARLLQLDTYVPCLTALQQGQADAVSTDEAILVGLVKRDANTKIVGRSFSDEPYGIGVRKDRTGFVEFMNRELARMLTDGTMKRLWDKHIKPLTATEWTAPDQSKPTPAP